LAEIHELALESGMSVVTTEQVICSFVYDHNRDVVVCEFKLKLTNIGKSRLLSQALNTPGSNALADHRKQALFFQSLQSQLEDAAFESVEEINSLSFEFEGKIYEFVRIVAPGDNTQDHYFEWIQMKE
jgi:tRNA 2-selenouridine synthase SelU